jgi:maltose alpha-D-glucosyltransferase/alpha-amylase
MPSGQWSFPAPSARLAPSRARFALVGEAAIIKLYRRLRSGEQPEIEVARFPDRGRGLCEHAAFLSSAEHVTADGESTAFAAAFAFVPNRGDTWGVVLDALEQALGGIAGSGSAPDFGPSLDLSATLGRRTAEMHVALATPTDNPAFAAERIGAADLGGWVDAARDEANHGFALVERASANVPEADRHDLERLLGARQTVLERLEAIASSHPRA